MLKSPFYLEKCHTSWASRPFHFYFGILGEWNSRGPNVNFKGSGFKYLYNYILFLKKYIGDVRATTTTYPWPFLV